MERAKTLTGLAWQAFRVRWRNLGGTAKTLLIAFVVLGAATALHFTTCLMGGCPSRSAPCHGAQAADSDAPCPYSANVEAEAPEAADDDVPCHARQPHAD